jgi:hypothetical protein
MIFKEIGMVDTQSLRNQHYELLSLVHQILNYIKDEKSVENNISEIKNKLIIFSAKLKNHLIFEDTYFYAELYKNSTFENNMILKDYTDEMKNFHQIFDEFMFNWINSGNINNNIKNFIKDTRNIFNILGNRIDKENNELFKHFE